MTTRPTIRRHPFRAAFWGLLLGLGIGLYLTFVFPVIAFDTIPGAVTRIGIVVAAVVLVSVLWGLFAPPRRPRRGRAPGPAASPPPAPMSEGAPPPMPAPPSPASTPPEAPDRRPPAPPSDEEPPPAPPA